MSATLQHKDYTVGWICALPAELSAARAMLDEIHESLSQPPTDHNAYTLGRVGKHNIVLAGLPLGGTGTNSAAIVADQMMHSFTIRFGLMVGIGGGAPSSDCDLRLGDVVVSKPGLDDGGVVQYDFGKTLPGGFRRTHTLNKPPTVLLTALTKLMSEHDHNGNKIAQYLEGINKMKTPSNYKHPGPKYDQLYVSYYDHVDPDPKSSCDKCDSSKLVHRADRGSSNDVQVFYGTIASGNRVMRSGVERDRLRKELGVLCFEMEAAGLMDNFPCVVIRGICDYADSHKDKRWQGYAAATAAACAKELLSIMPTEHVNDSPVTEPTLSLPPPPPNRNPIVIPRQVPFWILTVREPGHYQDYWHDPKHITPRMESRLAHFMQQYREFMSVETDGTTDSVQKQMLFRAMLKAADNSMVANNDEKRTLLHYMAMNGVTDTIQAVVEAGFDVEARDSDYRTPLHLAVIGNHAETVDVLVERCGANVHAQDLNKLLPWHCAVAIDLDNGIDNSDRISSKMQILRLLAAHTDLGKVSSRVAKGILQRLKDDPTADMELRA